MAKIHYKTLASAVEKYSPLKGHPEAEIREAIAADEKGFDSEAVDAIYEAIVGEDPATPVNTKTPEVKEKSGKKKQHVVVNEFHDIANWNKVYKAGSDVSHFDADRLKRLADAGLIE